MYGIRALGTLALLFQATGVTLAAEQVPLQQLGLGAASTRSLDGSILSPAFHAFVDELRKNASIPGISVGVVRLRKDYTKPQVELASWGRRTEDGDANDLTTDVSSIARRTSSPEIVQQLILWTPQTLFGIASCSKAFLATSVGLLIDDFAHGRNVTPLPAGTTRLDWDTKIAAILPDEWQLDDEWATRAANIRDVLGHVSGLPRYVCPPGQAHRATLS